MDNAWLYAVTFVSILTALYCGFRSHGHWKQMQRQRRWMDNTLYYKNAEISDAKMQVNNSRADVIRLCGVIEARNAEIEELITAERMNDHIRVIVRDEAHQIVRNETPGLIYQHAPNAIADDLSNPNSKTSKAIYHNVIPSRVR
jgi:hypothetical protein